LAELKAKGIKGTPITEESFKAWQERKRKKREAEAKKLVEKELKKKKGGKPLLFFTDPNRNYWFGRATTGMYAYKMLLCSCY
jgi:hypothetical protein